MGVEFEARDFFKEPFAEDELAAMMKLAPPSEIFSWRSPSLKSMDVDRESLMPEDLLRLMLQEPRLIRRPILRVGDRLIVGANLKTIEAALREE